MCGFQYLVFEFPLLSEFSPALVLFDTKLWFHIAIRNKGESFLRHVSKPIAFLCKIEPQ